MTGAELRAFRKSLRFGVVSFAYWLGMRGNNNTVSVRIREMERGKRYIPDWVVNHCIEHLKVEDKQ